MMTSAPIDNDHEDTHPDSHEPQDSLATEIVAAVEDTLAPVVRSPRRFLLLMTIAATVLLLDLATKIAAVWLLDPGSSPSLFGGVVYLSLIRNPGAAFSLASGMTWVLALVTILVVVVIVRAGARLTSKPWAIGLGLVLGGALGNLTDRLFRAPGALAGHVVDFISLIGPYGEHFPVFNIADAAIVIGGLTVIVTVLSGRDIDGQPFARPERHIPTTENLTT